MSSDTDRLIEELAMQSELSEERSKDRALELYKGTLDHPCEIEDLLRFTLRIWPLMKRLRTL